MSGIRVDTEWLARYAGELRAAGDDIVAVCQELESGGVGTESFGEVGRRAGAAQAYQRVAALLIEQTRRHADVLTGAGDELHEVVGSHAGGDADSAAHLTRKQDLS